MMAELRKLYSLAPRFELDKDEDWMAHLPSDKKTFLVDKRAEILAILEQIENHAQAYRQLLASIRNSDPARKQQAHKEFEDKKKIFENTRDRKIRELIPEMRKLKDQGIRLKELEQRRQNATFGKRRRLQEMLDPSLEMSSEVEFVTDDYYPSYLRSYMPQEASKKRPKPRQNINFEMPIPKTSPNKKRDTFLDGVDEPDDRKVLTDLRSEIVKYNCRDRVLKAMQSIRSRDNRFKTLAAITRINEMMKSSEN